MVVKKERIFYYDFLRAIAIIAVICCHVTGFFGDLNTFPQIIYHAFIVKLGTIGVPIFLMLSGALLLNREYDLSDFIKRRFSRICYPFIFWIIIIMLVCYFVLGLNAAAMWKIFIGKPSMTWYFWVLIGVYLSVPIINSFVKDFGKKGLEYFLVIWFAVVILKTFDFYPIIPFLRLDYFAGHIGLLILGYYLDNYVSVDRGVKMLIVSLLIFSVSLSVIIYLYMIGSPLLENIYINIFNVLLSIGAFLFVKTLSKYDSFNSLQNNLIGKAIVSISICSYGIYFAHFIILRLLHLTGIQSNKLVPFVVLFALVSSWILVYLLAKIPHLKKFVGV